MAATSASNHHHGDHGHGHDSHAGGHGGPKLYWIFCLILCTMTFLEWLVFKKREEWNLVGIMVPMLLGMSAVKFVMVVGWYMHLRYDPGWMKKIFVASLVMGGGTAFILVVLMGKQTTELQRSDKPAAHGSAPAGAAPTAHP